MMEDGQLVGRYDCTVTAKDGKAVDPNDRFFILNLSRPDVREHAAIAAYVETAKQTGYPQLADSMLSQRVEEMGWIHVSERLPEAMESVLVQMKDGEMKVAYRTNRFIGNSVAVRTDWLLGNPNDVVIAWQPLPPPYVHEDSDGR